MKDVLSCNCRCLARCLGTEEAVAGEKTPLSKSTLPFDQTLLKQYILMNVCFQMNIENSTNDVTTSIQVVAGSVGRYKFAN